MSINVPFDENRPAVTTPNGRYRYQLAETESGVTAENMLNVWRRDRDGSWLVEMMVYLDDEGGPELVGLEKGAPQDEDARVESYMRAAGHIWAARTAGLWELE